MISALPLAASILTSGLSVATSGLVAMAVSWSIISSGADVTWAGVASFAIQLPVAAGLALGGLLSDRLGPRRVLLGSDALMFLAVAAAALAASGALGAAWVVALLSLGNFLGASGNVAQDSRVPEMARLAGLPLERANGLRDVAFNVGTAAGPALGVALVAAGGLPLALWGVSAALGVVLLLDAAFFPRFAARRRAGEEAKVIAGFAGFTADRVLLSVVVLGIGLIAVFASLDEIVAPSLAVAGGLRDSQLTLFLALNGAAALVSGLAYTAMGHRLRPHPVLVGGVSSAAAGFLALAALPPAAAFVAAPLLIGLGVGPLSPLVMTTLQRRVPAAHRGAVLGAFMASILFVQPFAALGAAPLVSAVGVGWVTWGLALLAAGAVIAAVTLPALRELDQTVPKAAPR
ncbi:MFS transporter [Belnapia sp. T18]|uniref:MFS transporter n=1 Tax=Belnapia arida TaxID=2804533 RepID=A0ABS1UCR3_9PROT|nr:MFS transporter [Belnapia arida]MBL6082305.1 MFS transporter [Belnapia arida]